MVDSVLPPAPTPAVISVFKEGDEEGSKSRITVPLTWAGLTRKIKDTLGIADIGKITDQAGASCSCRACVVQSTATPTRARNGAPLGLTLHPCVRAVSQVPGSNTWKSFATAMYCVSLPLPRARRLSKFDVLPAVLG